MTPRTAAVAVGWLALALAAVRAIDATVAHIVGGGPLPLGAEGPLPTYAARLSLWLCAGTIAWVCASRGLHVLAGTRLADRVAVMAHGGRDGAWMGALSLVATGLAVAVRVGALHGTDLGVDEAAYRFQAALFLHAVPYVPSPPDKLFFDTVPMVNDGRWYAPHGPGWPLLLAPFQAVGIGGLAAAAYLGGTVPAVFLVARRWFGSGGARLAALLYATAPLAVLGGATQLPGTSAAFLLAWALWAVERSRDAQAPPWVDPLLGACLALGIAVDAPTGVGLAVALVGLWAWGRAPGARSVALVLAPLALAACALLALQVARTGSPWVSGWQRAFQYAAENRFRFTWIDKGTPGPIPHVRVEAWRALVIPLVAGFRIAVESLGWPFGILPAALAGRARAGRVGLAVAAGVLIPNAFLVDLGPGLYGPERVHVLLVPAVLAVVAGLREVRAWNPDPAWGRTLGAMVAGAVLVAGVGYAPLRVEALAALAADRHQPEHAARRLRDAVVFVPDARYAPNCKGRPWRVPVRRPVGDPWLRDPVLWVNHLSLQADERLVAERFPDRRGFLLVWHLGTCDADVIRLDKLTPGDVPADYPPARAALQPAAPPWARGGD